jgi:hypothetical protein
MKNAIFSGLPIVALLLAGGVAASAQDDSKPSMGVHVQLVNPMGKTADIASMGFGVGAFYELPIVSGLSVRGSASYNIYGGYELDTWLGLYEYKLNQIGIVADAKWYFDKKRSIYALAGAGYYINSMDLTLGGTTLDSDDAGSGLGIGVGAGWYFHENFGVEAKYVLTGDTPHATLSFIWRL